MNMKPILTHREFIYLYLLVIKSSTVHGDLQTFTERHCCFSFESPEKPQLTELAASPKKIEANPLAPDAKPDSKPELSKTASMPVEEPLLITALKEEEDVKVRLDHLWLLLYAIVLYC